MDCYYVSQDEDHAVPKVQETSEITCVDGRFPLPGAWVDWGVTLAEKFGPPNRSCAKLTKQVAEKFNFDRQIPYSEFCYAISSDNVNNSVNFGGFSLVSYSAGESVDEHRLLDEQPDCQLQNLCQNDESLSSMQWMDDIFMNSLLEEDPPEASYQSDALFPDSECSSTPFENSVSTEKELSCIGSSRYLKGSGLPLMADQASDDWEDNIKEEDRPYSPLSYLSPATYGETGGSPKIKVLTVLIPTEQNTPGEEDMEVEEEDSLEATVLQELEVVMTKLTPKTRICFRDALYRLARCTELHVVNGSRSFGSIMEASCTLPVHNERSRCGVTKSGELEKNAIDQAIGNLMFNKHDSGTIDFSCLSSMRQGKEALLTTESEAYSLNQPQVVPSPHLPISLSCEEVELPFSGRESENRTSLLSEFSRTEPVEIKEYVISNISPGKQHGFLW